MSWLDEIKDRLRHINKRIVNPIALSFAGRLFSPYAIVQHTGRRSGKLYTTPVVAIEMYPYVYVPLPYGTETDWCRNVIVAGVATLVNKGRALKVHRPEILDAEGIEGVFPPWIRYLLDRAETDHYLRLVRASTSPEPASVYSAIVTRHPTTPAVLVLAGAVLAVLLGIRLIRRREPCNRRP